MAFEIIGTGRAVPCRRVSNDELAKKIDTSDEWIRSHTGIGARHIAEDETATSDLALEAAKKALLMAAGRGDSSQTGHVFSEEDEKTIAEAVLSLDLIVLATVTPDFFGSPSTSCILQGKLGAKNAAAMDITAACSGFVYALETAAALLSISADRKRALVVGAETLTKFVNWSDRGTCVLVGDGSGAVVLEKTEAPAAGPVRRGLLRTTLGADGTGADFLLFRGGGSRSPYKKDEGPIIPIYLEMDGKAVYNFAVKTITETIDTLLKSEGIAIDDLALIVPHQANARIIQAAAKRLKIPLEKFYLNIEEYANTSSASIPIALDELNRNGKIRRGDLILTIGFGGGLTYGANLIVW